MSRIPFAGSEAVQVRASNIPAFAAEVAAIAIGGGIGAGLRFAVALAIAAVGLPGLLGVAIANLSGSFVLGLFVGYIESGRSHPLLRPFLTVGVLGSFTTFSTLALESRGLAGEDGEAIAAFFLGGSIALGLMAFVIGDVISVGLRERASR